MWRVYTSPQVCALRVTDGARRRILKAGGEIMTFDQLALAAPKGQGTVLLSGDYSLSPRYRRNVMFCGLVFCFWDVSYLLSHGCSWWSRKIAFSGCIPDVLMTSLPGHITACLWWYRTLFCCKHDFSCWFFGRLFLVCNFTGTKLECFSYRRLP